jgi:uncharacterized Tic20 family protein
MSGKNDSDFEWMLIFWIIVSFIVSFIFAKYSKGLCNYLFFTIAWIYITILVTQVWEMGEKEPEEITYTTVASLAGWILGTFIVWKSRRLGTGFFMDTP